MNRIQCETIQHNICTPVKQTLPSINSICILLHHNMLYTMSLRTIVITAYCLANPLRENTFLCRTQQNITGFRLVHTNKS